MPEKPHWFQCGGSALGIIVMRMRTSRREAANESKTSRRLKTQLFRRYPVLKIHHTTSMHIARNVSVMPILSEGLTSAIS
jgi:hypothetical protein